MWCTSGVPVPRQAISCWVRCAQEEEDENAEAEAENQEGKLAWAGGRREEATYEAGDAEDSAIAAAAQRAAQQQDDVPDVSPDVSTPPILVPCTACPIC